MSYLLFAVDILLQLENLKVVGITHIVCVKHPGEDVYIRANFPEHFRYFLLCAFKIFPYILFLTRLRIFTSSNADSDQIFPAFDFSKLILINQMKFQVVEITGDNYICLSFLIQSCRQVSILSIFGSNEQSLFCLQCNLLN